MKTRSPRRASPKRLALAGLGAIGVVYGDIGTSPLYALRECFHGRYGVALDHASVLGVLSLILWALILVVTVKYLTYVMRADNDGEGGVLALLALALGPDRPVRRQRIVFWIGIIGAALLFGDAIITPAISVLSAVEGLRVEAPVLAPIIVPVTVVILIGVFAMQHRGTARVAAVFGPIMLLWFVVLGVLGVRQIVQRPEVLLAISPSYAVEFFVRHQLAGAIVFGAVVLVVTGAEALYADMGHFGKRPIRLAWLFVVLPALMLDYLGQGALLLSHPEAVENPLMFMAPPWGRVPLLLLATTAAVIASQALISGTFSIARQAILLGYAPRLAVVHTSTAEIGQIYLPAINWGLMLATVTLVIGFGSSSALAAAYGIAVTGAMVMTTLLAHVVARRRWQWPLPVALAVTASFLAIDLAFFSANMLKLLDGGWVPLAVAAAVFTSMTTWRRGRAILRERIAERSIPLESLEAWLAEERATRVPGTAVYMTAHPSAVPHALIDNVRHNRSIHEEVIMLSILFARSAHVLVSHRLEVELVCPGVKRLIGHYGFVESPDVPALLRLAIAEGVDVDPDRVTYVLGRETLLPSDQPGMARWREAFFSFMSRNAERAAAFFRIPSHRVLEVGTQIDL
jgi:KUP system potassium uptake protein